ncbi:MAG: hypothetical protein LBS60_15130 [Deltaproteobacteria bacterium]|nr:hypothetical protein [Deltaproteobacteria bacterium]
MDVNWHKEDNKFVVELAKSDHNAIILSNILTLKYLSLDLKEKAVLFFPSGDQKKDYKDFLNIVNNNPNNNVYLYFSKIFDISFLKLFENKLSLLFNGHGALYKYNK